MADQTKLDEFEKRIYPQSVAGARFYSNGSIDPSTRHGVIIWDVAISANGEPELIKISDGNNRFTGGVDETDQTRWQDRSWKYKIVSHGEVTAIVKALAAGNRTKDANITVPAHPCYRCAGMIIESGLKRLVMDANEMTGDFAQRWAVQIDMARRAFADAGIEVVFANAEGKDPYALVDQELQKTVDRIAQSPEQPIKYKHDYPRLANLEPRYRFAGQNAELLRSQSPIEDNKQAAVIFDEAGSTIIGAYNRPPRGTNPASLSEEELVAFTMEPERIIIANAAREGINLDGKALYTTYHPRGQGAAAIIGAGVKEIFIDAQSLNPPAGLEVDTAKDIWAAAVMFREAGVRLNFVNIDPGLSPYQAVEDVLGDDMIRISQAVHLQFRDAIIDSKATNLRVLSQHLAPDIESMSRDQILEANPKSLGRLHHNVFLDFRLEEDIPRNITPGPTIYIPRTEDVKKGGKDIAYLCQIRDYPAPACMTFAELIKGEQGRTFAFAGGYQDVDEMARHAIEIYGDKLKPDSKVHIFVPDPIARLSDSEAKRARAQYNKNRAQDTKKTQSPKRARNSNQARPS